VHRTAGDLADRFGPILAFAASGRETRRPSGLRFEVSRRALTLGLYRRPTGWRVTWEGSDGSGALALRAVATKRIKSRLVGGFAMSIVRGELDHDGRSVAVFGLAELIL
jgi:hypothetical protein